MYVFRFLFISCHHYSLQSSQLAVIMNIFIYLHITSLLLETIKFPIFIILNLFSWYKALALSYMFLSFLKFNTNNSLFTIHTYVYIKTSIPWYQSHARYKGHYTQPYRCICEIVVSLFEPMRNKLPRCVTLPLNHGLPSSIMWKFIWK